MSCTVWRRAASYMTFYTRSSPEYDWKICSGTAAM